MFLPLTPSLRRPARATRELLCGEPDDGVAGGGVPARLRRRPRPAVPHGGHRPPDRPAHRQHVAGRQGGAGVRGVGTQLGQVRFNASEVLLRFEEI